MNDPFSKPNPDEDREPTPAALQRPQFYIRITSPFWARALLGANLLVFVAMIAYGVAYFNDWDASTNAQVLIPFGIKVNDLVTQGQAWRLFTAMFLHIGVLHLLSNLYALHVLGPMVEGYYGHPRFLAIYLIAGLTGSVASYIFSDAASAGASGAIFGLVGATTVYFLRYRENFGARGRVIVQNMLLVVAVNLIFGFSVAFIDNWGHLGGLLGGVMAAVGLLPRYRAPEVIRLGAQPIEEESKPLLEAGWVALCLIALWLALQWVINTRLGHL